jgi:1,4-alpha-glucan branching enzyme
MMNKGIEFNTSEFHKGKLYDAYHFFGAHVVSHQERKGVYFRLWAPHAQRVSLVGSFNYWNDMANPMEKITDSGIWECFFENIGPGEVYKYKIFTPEGGILFKADPYGFFSEVRPQNSSIVFDLNHYTWKDENWINQRNNRNSLCQPMNIYEIHAGSWKRKEDNNFLNYRELAEELVPYLKKMNFNYLEIMPLMEHPFDGSWGYQTTGYYSITSRYGNPEDLMYLIDCCHQESIGVILDWVPGHFCRDDHGLMNFDGTELYGKIDHPNWGTKKFDFSKSEVKNFLISNALFYFAKYHIDGIRVDGVTSILQLNFGMDGNPLRNINNGYEDLDGIDFLKELNQAVFKKYPFAIMAAEESTDWPLVTYPTHDGGLGFNYKWNMGWMNDTLSYIKNDPLFRKYFHDKITFSLVYAFSENFILPFSHDEVVHGKKSLIAKSQGSYEDQFKTLKLLSMYQMTHPGKKLSFMGNEWAPFIEWKYDDALEWFLLEYPMHAKHRKFIEDINSLYMNEKAMWYIDNSWDGFEWIDSDNRNQSIFSYIRKDKQDFVIIILNFTPMVYEKFRMGVPKEGQYDVVLNSDSELYAGMGMTNQQNIQSERIEKNGRENSILLRLPGLTGLIIKKTKNK